MPSVDLPPAGDFAQPYKFVRLRELFLEEDKQIRAATNGHGIRIGEVPGGVVNRVGTMVGEWAHGIGKVEA